MSMGRAADAGTTITMKDRDAAMKGTGTIMRKRGIVMENAAAIIMRNMGIAMENAAAIIMKSMSTVMRSMQIPVGAAMTTITMITGTIMRMRCSQVGEERRLRPTQKRKLSIF